MKSNFSKDESEKEEFAKIESENTTVPCYDRFGYIGATIVQNRMFELDTANRISAGGSADNQQVAIQSSSATLIKEANSQDGDQTYYVV